MQEILQRASTAAVRLSNVIVYLYFFLPRYTQPRNLWAARMLCDDVRDVHGWRARTLYARRGPIDPPCDRGDEPSYPAHRRPAMGARVRESSCHGRESEM